MSTSPPLHPAVSTLRIIGIILLTPAAVIVTLALALAFADLEPDLTVGSMFVARIALGVVLSGLVVMLLAAAIAWLIDRAWPSTGAWVSAAIGVTALCAGTLLLAGALIAWSTAPDSVDARTIAARMATTGLPFALAGAGLVVVAHAIRGQLPRPSYRVADAALAVALLLVGTIGGAPGALAFDVLPDVVATAALEASDAAPTEPVHMLPFNATLAYSIRDPVVGLGQNGPGSDAARTTTVDTDARHVVIEAAWDRTKATSLVVRLSYVTDADSEVVFRDSVTTPAYIVAPAPGQGSYEIAFFVADGGGVVPEVDITSATSFFLTAPPDDYSYWTGSPQDTA